jgi:diketogulonate reductase-like aldo/keto reductase
MRRFGATGALVPAVGQGTWPVPDRDALRRGIDLGMTHIDTAEMYGDGKSEEVVGEAIAPYPRESLFLVSKVLPSNGTRAGVVRACERSLRRMRCDYFDCYLIHWRGDNDLADTMRGLEDLVRDGKIRSLGVSNFDPWDLREASAALERERIACNQILYNLGERTPEAHELVWAHENDSAFVAYTPLARPKYAASEDVLASRRAPCGRRRNGRAGIPDSRSANVRYSEGQYDRARRGKRGSGRSRTHAGRRRRDRRSLPAPQPHGSVAYELSENESTKIWNSCR